MFDKLVWQEDRMLLDELVFRLEQVKNTNWELGKDCFIFYKNKGLIDLYQKYWSKNTNFKVNNLFELGLWDGGSVAFWFEILQPQKHVGIDLQQRGDSKYFKKYINARQINDRIKTYWSTNQADSAKLREIVNREFGSESLDLVIDDASHLYEPTKVSFETLFPLLCPGGLYIIEDWAWWHWKRLDPIFSGQTPLSKLIFELLEVAGSSTNIIENIVIYRGFTVIERGKDKKITSGDFKLDNHIYKNPQVRGTLVNSTIRSLKNWLKKTLNK
jgi:hypothetical protein